MSPIDCDSDREAEYAHYQADDSVRAPLRLGVIGCALGRSRYHLALQATPALQITGIADADERQTRLWARDIGNRVPAYLDVASLLKRPETYDALLIASPLASRAADLKAALQIGKPLLAEIPFAPGLDDADSIRQQAQTAGFLLMPALPRRFDPYFIAARQQLKAGDLGELQQIRCHWGFPIEGVEATEDIVTGGWNALVQTLGSQTTDLCRWWQGDGLTVSGDIDLKELGMGARDRKRRVVEGTLGNLIVTHLQGQSTHHLSRTRSVQPDERYLFRGLRGTMELIVSAGATAASTTAPALRCQISGQRFQTVSVLREPVFVGKTPLSAASLRIRNLLLHFADCVQLGTPSEVMAGDANKALEIVQAAYLSTQERIKINLPLRRTPDIARLLLPSLPKPPMLPPAQAE